MGACLPCLKQRFERALYWTKRRTICFWGERVDWGDSLKQGARQTDAHADDERDFGCPLGLGESSGGSENSIPLPPVCPESGLVLDGYTPDKEGKWRWSTSEALEAPRSSEVSADESDIDIERTDDDARRTIDLMIQVPEAVVLYGGQEDTSWIQGRDAFQGARYVPDGVTQATQLVLQIIKSTLIEIVQEEKPVGWEEMEIGFGIKRIWAERSYY